MHTSKSHSVLVAQIVAGIGRVAAVLAGAAVGAGFYHSSAALAQPAAVAEKPAAAPDKTAAEPAGPKAEADKPKADPDKPALAADEAAIAEQIKTLGDSDSDKRAAAAEALRQIVARYPSGTVYLRTQDGGEAEWRKKIGTVRRGMSKTDVLKILPAFPAATEFLSIGVSNSHVDCYRLDDHWIVLVTYHNGLRPDDESTAKLMTVPELKKSARDVRLAPPKDFSGTWTTWHVNGQKARAAEYQNGKLDGTDISYHDNGAKSEEQHYADGVQEGTYNGWYSDGKPHFTTQHRGGKQDGPCTWWYENGNKQWETNYDQGSFNGRDTHWHENGQISSINDYRQGVKHGLEASWQATGAVNYTRTFVDGKIVD
jgi:hypothetical protein